MKASLIPTLTMPGHNPKHNKKKAVIYRQKKYANKHSYRLALMAVLFVGIVGLVIGAIVYINNNSNTNDNNDENDNIILEDGDTAKISYKLWVDFDRDGVINWETDPPYQDSQFEANITENGLIPGFYKNVLGMKIGETKRFFLPANVDANGDGIDDNTGKPVESYANPGDQLFNMSLVFWVRIDNITKNNQPNSALTLNVDNESLSQLNLFLTLKSPFELSH